MTKTQNGITLLLLLLSAAACGGADAKDPQSAPKVSATTPAAGATGVASDATLTATFESAVNGATVTDATFLLTQGTTAVPGAVSYAGTTATFVPTSELAASLPFTATLTTGIEDAEGNALESDFVWTFTTGADTKAPFVERFSNTGDVTATFNEEMAAASLTDETFTVAADEVLVAGTVSYAGLVATFHPDAALAEGTLFTATVKGGAGGAADLDGNTLAADFKWTFTTGPKTSLEPVLLGEAGDYVILAQSKVSNVPTSAIVGDLALSPAAGSAFTGFALTEVTGYATSAQVTGKLYADFTGNTRVLSTALTNMTTAYTDAAGRPTPDFLELGTGAIGGLVLAPGLYKWAGTVTIASDVVLEGDANDVWIFQIAGDLTQAAAKRVTLRGGAKPSNVFWQVAGAVELGTTAHFEGIVLCKTQIAMNTGASFLGRALAQTAVTLDSNKVTQPAE